MLQVKPFRRRSFWTNLCSALYVNYDNIYAGKHPSSKQIFDVINLSTSVLSLANMQGSMNLYQSVYSSKKYVEYQPGNLKVILAAPHGGVIKPRSIPDRGSNRRPKSATNLHSETAISSQLPEPVSASVVSIKDGYTKEFTLLLADAIMNITGYRPHVIISHLHRAKMDANRNQETACMGVKEAEDAWTAYHGFIEQAKERISSRGLFLDIHGQSHPEAWIELGYTISAADLESGSYSCSDSSIAGLSHVHKKTSPSDFGELLFGANSFGGLLATEGYKVVPSPKHPSSGGGKYYTGGYSTFTHGSRKGGNVDAIQIESPLALRNKHASPSYAKDLAKVIVQYLDLYYR